MKYLALALLLCSLTSLSHAACLGRPLEMNPDMTHCQDDVDKTWHPVGSTWKNSRCMDCSCYGCCPLYAISMLFPDDCVKVFDPVACVYKVHKKDDPSVECPIYANAFA